MNYNVHGTLISKLVCTHRRVTSTKIRRAAATLVRAVLAEKDAEDLALLMCHDTRTQFNYYDLLQRGKKLAMISTLTAKLPRQEQITDEDVEEVDCGKDPCIRCCYKITIGHDALADQASSYMASYIV